MRQRGWSLRRIADELGVGHATVARDLAGVSSGTPAAIDGADGKTYRALRPAPAIIVHTNRDEHRALLAMEALGEDMPDRPLELRRIERAARDIALARRRAGGAPAIAEGPSWRIEHCALTSLEIADESVDLVLTDPPWQADEGTLALWESLGAFAARVLKPGRVLIAYSGSGCLAEATARLGRHLDYLWSGALLLPGQHSEIHTVMARDASTPIIFYSKGRYKPNHWFVNTIASTGPEKDAHPWQKPLANVAY